jgi:hypothetical protein
MCFFEKGINDTKLKRKLRTPAMAYRLATHHISNQVREEAEYTEAEEQSQLIELIVIRVA